MYMARAKRLRPIDDEIRLILLSKSQESDLNQSGIGALSSLSQNRVGIIFRGETPPATVGEVSAIATALGTTASAVVRQAEDALEETESTSRDVVEVDPLSDLLPQEVYGLTPPDPDDYGVYAQRGDVEAEQEASQELP